MSELGFNVPPTTRSYGDGTERPEKQGIDQFLAEIIPPGTQRRNDIVSSNRH